MQRVADLLHGVLSLTGQSEGAVQAGTPMTVTGNGTSSRLTGRGVLIFCPKASSGVWGQTAPCAVSQDRGWA
jgi:glutamate dehydrogenase/leucine dehydrogenase